MKKTLIVFSSVFLWTLLSGGMSSAAEKSLKYQSYANENEMKKVISKTSVEYEELSDDQTLISRRKQSDTCMMQDEFVLDNKEYDLISWERNCPEEDTEYTVERKGSSLFIKGKSEGIVVDKEIELGNKALHIYPKYSLSKFVLSKAPKMKLWTLRRDKLAKLPMKAIKKGEETIMVDGKEVEAIKVFYSIVGKMREKQFYHYYYYRKSDGMFLKKIEKSGRIEELVKEK